MRTLEQHAIQIGTLGFSVINSIYEDREISDIIAVIEKADMDNDSFKRSKDLFAIRQFLKEVPDAYGLLFNQKLLQVIKTIFGQHYFIVKSIYFDKPKASNWYVAYHQDLSVTVDRKVGMEGFGPWTKKQEHFGVQPPLEILENIFTVRIHLDPTNEDNGALRVLERSHLKKVCRAETIDRGIEKETVCDVGKGGVMVMRPLLLHSSGRSNSSKRRRVIHIEFSDKELPSTMNWAERMAIME